jgi:hypothetical protein
MIEKFRDLWWFPTRDDVRFAAVYMALVIFIVVPISLCLTQIAIWLMESI